MVKSYGVVVMVVAHVILVSVQVLWVLTLDFGLINDNNDDGVDKDNDDSDDKANDDSDNDKTKNNDDRDNKNLLFVFESLEKNGSIPKARFLIHGINKPIHSFAQRSPVVRSPVMGLAPGEDNIQQEGNPS